MEFDFLKMGTLVTCVHHMVFYNLDVDNIIENIKKAKYASTICVNIGKNKDTPIEHDKIRLFKLHGKFIHMHVIVLSIFQY